jgi:purine-cytosine permease-like protein
MTTLPPPIPGMPPRSQSQTPPPIAGVKKTAPKIHAEDFVHASKLPLVIAVTAVVVSLVLAIALNRTSTWINVIGYLLTPFTVIACAGLDSVQQRRRATTDEYFLENSKYSFYLRILSGVALLISIPHINAIATSVAAWLAR